MSFKVFLQESLDTATEFTITDDSNMPKEAYCSFIVNGNDYGADLILSNYEKIYILRVYKINNKKPRYWKFSSPSDVKTVLATTIKFVESCLPWMKQHLNAIMIHIPKNVSPEKYNKFVSLVIRKTYMQTFRGVPVSFDLDNPNEKKRSEHFIFFMRKQLSAKNVFSHKRFKSYDFLEDGQVPVELALDIKHKKQPKKTLSTEPSKKYTVKEKLSFDMTNNNFENLINSVKPLEKDTSLESDIDKKIEKQKKELEKLKKEYETTKEKVKNEVKGNIGNLLSNVIPAVFKSIAEKGYDPSKMILDNLKYSISQNIKSHKSVLEVLRAAGFIGEDSYDLTSFGLEELIATFKNPNKMKNIVANTSKHMEDGVLSNYVELYNLKKQVDGFKIDNKNGSKVKISESNVDPFTLDTNVEGYGDFYIDTELGKYDSLAGCMKEKGESTHLKEKYMLNTLGYRDKVNALPYNTLTNLLSYSGSSYTTFNTPLRSRIKSYLNNEKIQPFTDGEFERISTMYKAFELLDPLPEPIWVNRGALMTEFDDIKVGNIYTDPAFMSTSMNSMNTFGLSNLRLQIYIPEGSVVVPLLASEHTHNHGEYEIVLPPLSCLKIIRVDEMDTGYGHKKLSVYAIFMGSAYPDFLEKYKQHIGEAHKYIMENEDKNKKYNPNGKFGGPVDTKMLKKLQEMLKKKQLKISKTNKKK